MKSDDGSDLLSGRVSTGGERHHGARFARIGAVLEQYWLSAMCQQSKLRVCYILFSSKFLKIERPQLALFTAQTTMLKSLKAWARRLKCDVITLMFASRDPATPLLPKLLAFATVAYALSPIDLIPDFIPVIGYLDDVIIVPVGIWLCLRLLPPSVIVNNRAKAVAWLASHPVKPRSMIGLAIVVCIWSSGAWLCWRWFARNAA